MTIMWLCFNDGFVSVVADKNSPDRLLVRARRKQDLLNVVGTDAEIVETPHRDYRWRAFVGRDSFKVLLAARLDAIQYTNFKNSVKDDDLHEMYFDFWDLHHRYQEHHTQSSAAEQPTSPARFASDPRANMPVSS